MSSILTNTSAMTAVRVLAQTQSALAQSQNQLSTGQRISSAADNASYWAIATQMGSDVGAQNAVQGDIAVTSSVIGVTSAALQAIIATIGGIKNDLVAAAEPGADLAKIQSDIAVRQSSIINTANAATFDDQNWLIGRVNIDSNLVETHNFSTTQAAFAALTSSQAGTATENVTDELTFTATNSNGVSQTEVDTAHMVDTYSRASPPAPLPGHPAAVEPLVTSSSADPIVKTGGIDLSGPQYKSFVTGYTADGGIQFSQTDTSQFQLFVDNTGKQTETLTNTYSDGQSSTSTSTIDNSVLSSDGFDPSFTENTNLLAAPFTLGTGTATVLSMSTVGASAQDLKAMLSATDGAVASLTNAAAAVGGMASFFQTQSGNVSVLTNSLTTGIGSLVDADMNEVSSKMAALQVQQQLGIQSLGIANTDASVILRLLQAQ